MMSPYGLHKYVSSSNHWCQFDCQWVRQHAASVPAQQVLVSCNFCSLAASPYLQMLQGGRHQSSKSAHLATATSQNKTKRLIGLNLVKYGKKFRMTRVYFT
ncbi:hypothetical protein HPB52_022267 [Rhipicephalus sanguineus]|uniref:Uncharacterized protein n=1 Tax=Rhipicephalus sanguineus TaxID=34632 RepID=A0A9D4Q392_RHISA|nr:hypothetical protein HPB52_022267 [Rhipicephalus sanguineus]